MIFPGSAFLSLEKVVSRAAVALLINDDGASIYRLKLCFSYFNEYMNVYHLIILQTLAQQP